MRPMMAVSPVGDPASSTEVPLYTFTCTSSPLRTAAPTSTELSAGSPRRTLLSSPLGANRTMPRVVGNH